MRCICHIHNYTEYNEQWNVFSAFNPSKLEQWAADCAAPGEQFGVSVPCSRVSPQSFQVKFKVQIFGQKVRHASARRPIQKPERPFLQLSFCSVRLNAWKAKATGHSMPSWSCERTASAAVAETSQVINVGQSILNCAKKGGLVNSSLSVRTTSEQAKDQVHGASFFSSWQRGYVIVEYWGRKRI